MKANILFAASVMVAAAGILFVLQGANLVAWPRESFMIGQRDWIERGILVALIGAALMLAAARIRRD